MESRPKILVFIDWFTPGYKAGGPVRSCVNMMHYLKSFADFYVVCSDTEYMETEPYANITYGDWNQLDVNVKVRYLKKSEINRNVYRDIMSSQSFKTVYINGIYSRSFSLMPLLVANNLRMNIVVAVRGMLRESAINVKGFKKKLFLRVANFFGYYKRVTFHATNSAESQDVKKRISKFKDVIVADNLPRPIKGDLNLSREKKSGQLKMVSLARIAPEKNLLYALQVLSELNTKEVITFDIYGSQYDENYWKECQAVIEALPENIRVTYKGDAHADQVLETLSAYHLLFLPTQGENFGHAILESLTAATPVLISDQTPWNRLERDGVGADLPLNDKSLFAEKIKQFASMEQSEFNQYSSRAFNYAEQFITNMEAVNQYKKLFLIDG